MLSENELKRICLLAHQLNDFEPLNGDDIDDITKALKRFNAEEEE